MEDALPETVSILFQEPGVTIAFDPKRGGMAPYPPAARPDGSVNRGFIDLRENPELARSIPEAQGSPAFQDLLVALNGSRFMSYGCERGLFQSNDLSLPVYIGSYVSVAFRDLEANRSKDNLVALAKSIADKFKRRPAPAEERVISLELIIEPVKVLFHLDDAFSLMMKLLAYGRDETEAKSTFEWLSSEIAVVIDGLQSQTV